MEKCFVFSDLATKLLNAHPGVAWWIRSTTFNLFGVNCKQKVHIIGETSKWKKRYKILKDSVVKEVKHISFYHCVLHDVSMSFDMVNVRTTTT